MSKSLILCDCLGTQAIDAESLSSATGLRCSRVHSHLCGQQINSAAEAIAAGDVVIACGQEVARFEELAAELAVEIPDFVDLRDRAGWSAQGEDTGPKMAALAAESQLPGHRGKSIDITSDGLCLILGKAEHALPAAEALSTHLSVTVLLDCDPEFLVSRSYDVAVGKLKGATGSLGQFSVRIDTLRQVEPGGRGAFGLGPPRDGARSECDLILDLTGNPPLFPAPEKRDGYLRADPGSQPAIAAAVLAASHFTGTFEKPLYVSLTETLCAHSRAEQEACRNCLDICPTGAITPAGEHVTIDANICAGCGACAALCPSGAIEFDHPPVGHLIGRMQTLASTFGKAGGKNPRILVHDRTHGVEMIGLAARFGRGLPADVLPLELEKVSGFGHAEMLAALASGFASVNVLISPDTERDVLDRELLLAQALAGESRARLLDPADPDALSEALYADKPTAPAAEPVLPMGSRRQIARLATKLLRSDAETPIPLPAKAPYGAVLVDTDACTLCLSCASLCPSGALTDNPDMPQLNFQEDACLQCGLCANVCPEDAISLEPQMDISDAALSARVLNEEEPFECIECGAAFGVKSTIEKIAEKLEGKHSMFATSDAARMIRMCDNCRINAQFHSKNNPFAAGERPKTRTTEDYLKDRKIH